MINNDTALSNDSFSNDNDNNTTSNETSFELYETILGIKVAVPPWEALITAVFLSKYLHFKDNNTRTVPVVHGVLYIYKCMFNFGSGI